MGVAKLNGTGSTVKRQMDLAKFEKSVMPEAAARRSGSGFMDTRAEPWPSSWPSLQPACIEPSAWPRRQAGLEHPTSSSFPPTNI